MPSLSDKSTSPAPAPDTMNLPAKMPRIPEAVLDRFPEMENYQSEMDRWWGVVVGTVSETNEESSTVINQNNTGLIDLRVVIDGVELSIIELAEFVDDGFGNLSGKYTLTVTAGDVVTGMNITSSTGPGTNISEVAFQADKFQIYSGTTKKVMFVADAIDDVVRLADTLVVDAANGKVYIGDGTFDDPGTPWYVDDLGRMSLKDKFVWDGTTLAIEGEITADSGTIGGFTLGPTELTAGTGDDYIEITSDPAGKGFGIQLGIEGSFHFVVFLAHTGMNMSYQEAVGDDYPGVKMYVDDTSDGCGVLELSKNDLSAATIELRGDTGVVDASGGFRVGASVGATTTFDPATVTSMEFVGGLLISAT
jgi:hypothetical protein